MRGNAALQPAAQANGHRILIIDDDPLVRVLLKQLLSAQGYDVSEATNARVAESLLEAERWSLVLLDRRLPDCDGLLLLRSIKESSDCPVVILTVMNDEHDRTLGLGLGAHDYITKPFSAAEVQLRIKNILRGQNVSRPRETAREIVQGPLRLIQTTRRLETPHGIRQLTAAETRLLALLMTNAGEVLDRDSLTMAICGRDWSHNDRSIDVLVARLRKHVETDPKHPEWIITVHGAGYLFANRPLA